MRGLLLSLALLVPATASAQEAASTTIAQSNVGRYPPGVSVRTRGDGFYYADARGMTLYVLDQRIASARTGLSVYCVGPCTTIWTPYVAAADATALGDWTIVANTAGRQWAYKRKPVFLYDADARPGDMAGDKIDDLWAVIDHIPPPPFIVAPATVTPVYRKTGYVLNDLAGRALFTVAAPCEDCTPFAAGMAARAVGAWTVLRGETGQQWAYRGKPVFVAPEDTPARVPAGGAAITP